MGRNTPKSTKKAALKSIFAQSSFEIEPSSNSCSAYQVNVATLKVRYDCTLRATCSLVPPSQPWLPAHYDPDHILGGAFSRQA
jgi:hypothetical protein